jgi:hypothetical protein
VQDCKTARQYLPGWWNSRCAGQGPTQRTSCFNEEWNIIDARLQDCKTARQYLPGWWNSRCAGQGPTNRTSCLNEEWNIIDARLQDNICPDGGMVDTQDLKSCDHYGCAGSSPAPGTPSTTNPLNINKFRGFNFFRRRTRGNLNYFCIYGTRAGNQFFIVVSTPKKIIFASTPENAVFIMV